MNYRLLLFGVFLYCQSSISAQKLTRPAGPLGIQPTAVTIREAMAAGLDGPFGAKVYQVFPNSVADQMGLEPGDIISQLNGQPIQSFNQIYGMLKSLKAEQEIRLAVQRGSTTMDLSGTMGVRNLPAAPTTEVRFEEIAYGKGTLRGFVEKPKGAGPFPTIFFLQGYPCSSVEFINPQNPFRKLINQWVEKGYAVFRVEKPGVGDSQTKYPCSQTDFYLELGGFKHAYKALLQYDFVDKDQLFLYGHSLGASMAPILALDHMPTGIMVYGFVIKSWEEYLKDIMVLQNPLFGTPVEIGRQQQKDIAPLFNAFFQEKKAPADFLKSQNDIRLFTDAMNYDGNELCFGRHYRFWQTLNGFDMNDYWSRVNCPVLSLYGEADLTALNAESAQKTAAIINKHNPGNGTFKFVKETDHALIKVSSREEKAKLLQTNQYKQYFNQRFNDDYINILDRWMTMVKDRG